MLQQTHFLIDSADVLYYIEPFTCDLTRPGCRNSDGLGFIDTDTYKLTTECNNDLTTLDSGGNDCTWYVANPGSCGSFNDVDFTASV